MNVFLTGASGYVGRHVAQELMARGHQVTGLARKPSNRTSSPIEWCFADLEQYEDYRDALESADCIVHCAMGYSDSGAEDVEADAAFVERALASGNFLIYTGNLYSSRSLPDDVFKEELIHKPEDWRLQNERLVLGSIAPAAVIRLGFVYGGEGGYLWPMLPPEAAGGVDPNEIREAVWPMVQVQDVAALYAIVAETRATGVFHAYDGCAITAREIIQTLQEVYPPGQNAGADAHEHINALLTKSIRTTNSRSLAAGWKPAFSDFRDHAAAAYAQYLAYSRTLSGVNPG
ncbi:MAG: nucleoside-diphosphate-sugar epimerase [Rhodothermales bacterium]|jgi:nucleoside-diphosphate-sugar epimerase